MRNSEAARNVNAGRLAPALLESGRIAGGVSDGVLDIAVSEIVLNEPCIRALVGQSEAVRLAQHVEMSEQGQGSGGGAVFPQE